MWGRGVDTGDDSRHRGRALTRLSAPDFTIRGPWDWRLRLFQIGSGNEKAEYALEKMRRGTKKMFRQKSKDPVVWYEKNQDEVLRHSLHCIKGLCL